MDSTIISRNVFALEFPLEINKPILQPSCIKQKHIDPKDSWGMHSWGIAIGTDLIYIRPWLICWLELHIGFPISGRLSVHSWFLERRSNMFQNLFCSKRDWFGNFVLSREKEAAPSWISILLQLVGTRKSSETKAVRLLLSRASLN